MYLKGRWTAVHPTKMVKIVLNAITTGAGGRKNSGRRMAK